MFLVFTSTAARGSAMAKTIHTGRLTTASDAESVVFLLGMRINRLWAVPEVARVGIAMGRMIAELLRHGDLGLLSARTFVSGRDVMVVQYWRSAEELQEYARADGRHHLPAWRDFNHTMRAAAHIGIWHETYRVAPGMYEAIYVNMPSFGLAAATGGPEPIGAGRHSAAARLSGVEDRPVMEPS